MKPIPALDLLNPSQKVVARALEEQHVAVRVRPTCLAENLKREPFYRCRRVGFPPREVRHLLPRHALHQFDCLT